MLTVAQSLVVTGTVGPSAKALAALAVLTSLTSLDLAHTKLDDAALAAIAEATPRLRQLSLRGTAVSERGLARCRCLARLEVLSLRTCEVGNGAVEALLRMPRLRDLDLAYTEISDAGLLAMAPLTRLQSLSLACRRAGSTCKAPTTTIESRLSVKHTLRARGINNNS